MESSERNASGPPDAAAPGTEGEDGAGGSRARYRLALGLPGRAGWRGELWIVAFFALAALVLTWPMALTLGEATGTRGDYLNNLWNGWWVKHSIVHAHSPFWTDYLYFPEGISLRRHTLSPLNALSLAALTSVLDSHQAFSLLVMAHFALSGWCLSLLARYVSGSTAGGVLGGLVYSFCPFHYFYLCQINVFSFEFMPLALLFFLRHAREGGGRNLLGVVLALAGMAATIEYYVVYTYLALGALVLCARGWARDVAPALRWRRLFVASAAGAAVVALVALPLLSATLAGEGRERAELAAATPAEMIRFNDLLGFFWIGGPEKCTVSWPTMLGYSTLVLIALGWRRVLAHWPWLVTGAAAFVLSLGKELEVAGHATGIPLPYALCQHLPVLSLLRKSDRFYMLVQLVAGVLLAAAWSGLPARLAPGRARSLAWLACAVLTMVELTGVPFQRFQIAQSKGLEVLRDDASVHAVMELPVEQRHLMNARTDYYQTVHEKKTTLGYTTSTALEPVHDERLNTLLNLHYQFVFGQSRELPRVAARLGVDRIVHYKSLLQKRPVEQSIDGGLLWQPFFFLRRPLVFVRQVGEFVERPYPPAIWQDIELRMTRAVGAPLYEDDFMAVFPVPAG